MKLLICCLLITVLFESCSYKSTEFAVIKIKGSDTMLELTKNLANRYMQKNPGVSIYVDGGGTASGIRALLRNEIDICTASRNLKPEEAKVLADYYESLGVFFLVAKDALSIYINPDNPVQNISTTQLKDIYECKITNWKELGGRNEKIIPVIRNTNSGTHLYFKEHILEGEEYCDDVIVKPTTRSIIEYVTTHKNAIGYGGMGYKGNVLDAKVNGIEPSPINAINDTYPITRYLHFFTSRTPRGAIKLFIDWVLSPEGQSVVKQSGYIPLWEM